MAKKIRKLTEQEGLIASFAKHSISARTTFHPQLWPSGIEPADMVIVVGKALVLVNMTRSRKSYDYLWKHNIEQANKRLKDWKLGNRKIRGKNDWSSFSVDWTDIERIQIIGIVDGPYAACESHKLETLQLDKKVCLCTTLTSNVIYQLVLRGGGARDLIALCKLMPRGKRLSEYQTIRILKKYYNKLISETISTITKQPDRLGKAIIGDKPVSAFEEHKAFFSMARQSGAEGFDIFADLSWAEIFPAITFIVSTIAEIEWLHEGRIHGAIFGNSTKFMVIVYSTHEGFMQKFNEITNIADENNVNFIYTLYLSQLGPMGTVVVINGEAKATEVDLASTSGKIQEYPLEDQVIFQNAQGHLQDGINITPADDWTSAPEILKITRYLPNNQIGGFAFTTLDGQEIKFMAKPEAIDQIIGQLCELGGVIRQLPDESESNRIYSPSFHLDNSGFRFEIEVIGPEEKKLFVSLPQSNCVSYKIEIPPGLAEFIVDKLAPIVRENREYYSK